MIYCNILLQKFLLFCINKSARGYRLCLQYDFVQEAKLLDANHSKIPKSWSHCCDQNPTKLPSYNIYVHENNVAFHPHLARVRVWTAPAATNCIQLCNHPFLTVWVWWRPTFLSWSLRGKTVAKTSKSLLTNGRCWTLKNFPLFQTSKNDAARQFSN